MNLLFKKNNFDLFLIYTILPIKVANIAPIIPPIIPSNIKKKTSTLKLIFDIAISPSNKSKFVFEPIILDVIIQITEQKKDFQILLTTYIEEVHSILNNTPPRGVPSDKVIPAAHAAANILFFEEVDLLIVEKNSNFISLLQIKHDR